MTLRTQTISLPIVGGVNEKDDALLSSRPQQATNCRYRKTGAVSLRYGYSAVGPFNLRSDGSTPPHGENLFVRGNELVRIGGGKLDSFALTNGISDWVAKDSVPEGIGRVVDIGSSSGLAGYFSDPSIAVGNGYVLTSYISFSTAGGGVYVVCLDIADEATGTRVVPTIVLNQSSVALLNARVVITGTTAGIFWYDSAATSLKGYFYDLTTLNAILSGTVHASIANANYDVSVLDATHWVFFAESVAGAGAVFFAIDTTFAIKWAGLLAGETSLVAVSVRAVAGDRIYVAYGRTSAPWLVRIFTITTAGASEYGPTTVQTNASGSVINVAIERLEASRVVYAFTIAADGVYWNEAITIGSIAKVNSTDNRARDAFLLARPLVRSKTQAYALIATVHGTHSTPVLIDLAAESYIATGASARMVGVVLPRQLMSIRASGSTTIWLINQYPRLYGVADFPSQTAANTFTTIVNVPQDTVPGNSIGTSRMTPIQWQFDAAWKRTAVEVNGLLVIGGGVVTGYDGMQAYEIGFLAEPDIARCAAFTSSGSGSGLTGSSSYGYCFVYAWTDALGNTHRSAPSAARTIALGGSAFYNVSGTAPPMHLTNKFDAGALGPTIAIEVYRTTSNGATYYYAFSLLNVVNGAPVSFTDALDDATLSSQRKLYTTGGVLDHVITAGCSLVAAWKGALLLAGSDDDSISISGEILLGEGPWFNDSLNVSPFEGGRVTAISQLDDTPIIFKSIGAWYMQGEPPSDTGVTTIGLPKRVQTDAGCSDAASVIVTPQGIARMSSTGLYLLDRGLADRWIGANVEDSYRSGFAGAGILPAQGLVRWVQLGTGGGFDVLNLDYYHSDVYGTPVWVKDTLVECSNGGYANPVACAVWQGKFVWLGAAGYLYRESTTDYHDSWSAGGITNSQLVQMTFECAFEKQAGVSALQRVKRVYVTGQRTSKHQLTITLTTDAGSESRTWSSAEIDAQVGYPTERCNVHVASQKCQWMKVQVQTNYDLDAQLSPGDYSAFVLRDISLEVGVKPGGPRLPAANQK